MAHPIPSPGRPLARRAALVAAAAVVLVAVLAAGPGASAAGPTVTVSPNVDVSDKPGGQSEQAIAVDPLNPDNIVVVSNENRAAPGLLESISHDGGLTWTHHDIADNDALGFGCCDPTLSWDQFGNLFFGDLRFTANNNDRVDVVLSTDAGETWKRIASLKGQIRSVGSNHFQDQPTITTGEGMVWVTHYLFHRGVVVHGAQVTGRGHVGAFHPIEVAPNSHPGNYGDIAIGPQGQVMVAYQIPQSQEVKGRVRIDVDPDGLGPLGFLPPVNLALTNVGGFDFIPPQSGRSIDAEIGLAWDRSGGPLEGRVYAMYTREDPDESNDTNIWLRYSDDDGATWSTPQRLNDDTGTNSQFLPRIAVDQVTGEVAVTWRGHRRPAQRRRPVLGNRQPGRRADLVAQLPHQPGNLERGPRARRRRLRRLHGAHRVRRRVLPGLGGQLELHPHQPRRPAEHVRRVHGQGVGHAVATPRVQPRSVVLVPA
jgi:hypothetical protein